MNSSPMGEVERALKAFEQEARKIFAERNPGVDPGPTLDDMPDEDKETLQRCVRAMLQALSSKNELPSEVERMRNLLRKSRSWLFECWGWLLETDLDMKCPMETDPLDIVEEIDALLGIDAALNPKDTSHGS